MNNNYRLQLRHGIEGKAFSTRDEVISHIDGQLQYGGVSLLPYEPILFFYGSDDAKNTIIMVGLPEGKTQKGKSYFLVDTANLQEQINEVDSRNDELLKKIKEEEANRKAADEALEKAIKEEGEVRDNADKALEQTISVESKTREDADTAETAAREEKDAELEKLITFNAADIQSVIDACGLLYNEKLSEGRVSYEPDLHDEVIRDAKTVAEAIDKVSKFASQLGESLKFVVEDTDTVDLTFEEDTKNGGSVLKAEVKIAGIGGLSTKNFDNNIVGKTNDGLYASASIEPSTKNPNILIFKTSGYVDGKFKVDAYETEVPLTVYKGDNGKNSGITVDVDADKNLISATLNLASDKTNLLKLEDGEYMVEGLAKNIKYKDTTVAQALTSHNSRLDDIEDAIEGVKSVDIKGSETSTSTVSVEKSAKGDFTVTNNVKLSSDNSIIIANGGLEANVNAAFKKGTSTLVISVGQHTYDIDLSELAVSVLKKAEYDSVTEEIVLTFIVGDEEKTMRIPVGTLIHDVEADDTDTIDLTIKSVSGGPNRISGEVRVDKTHSDNILTVTSNGLYVSKAYITNAVKEEAELRSEADDILKAEIEKVAELANENKESISKEQTRAEKAEAENANAIAQEVKDARAAEKDNADAIEESKGLIADNTKAINAEVSRAQKAEQANTDAITAEASRAKEEETKNANAIASEINRATEKENDLLEKVGNNTSKIAENKAAIDQEVKDARAAEKANADAIVAEEKRATIAEAANATAISNEELRAIAAEEKNAASISEEVKRATKAEETLSASVATNAENITNVTSIANATKADLANEITRATAKENANANAIENEANRAKDAESKNSSDIATNAANIAKANESINTIDKTLTEEITRAKKAEEANTAAIVNETERAKVSEATNSDAISNEVSRAKKAEDDIKVDVSSNKESIIEIEKNLKNEITRAEAAENANATAVSTETKRATEVEKAMNEKIAKNASDIAAISTSVGDIELKKEGDLAYALYVNGTKHGEFTIPKDQFLKSVTYDTADKSLVFVFNTTSGEQTQKVSVADLVDTYTNGDGILLNGNVFSVDFTKVASVENVSAAIDTENKRAVEKENDLLNSITANANAINAEVVRAKEAENNNSAAITTEANAARTAEKANADAIVAEEKRATIAEAANATAISNEELRAIAAEEKNAASISEEVRRATKAEETLSASAATNAENIANVTSIANATKADLANEITRATAAEKANADSIAVNTESIATMTTKVNDIDKSVTEEITRAKKAEEANATAIVTEKERAMTAEGVNASTIADEIIRAKKAEEANATASAENKTAITTLDKALQNEVTRAIAAEKTNADAVVKENERALAAEKVVSDNLTQEILRAKESEKEITAIVATKADAASVYTKEEIVNLVEPYAKTADVQEKLDAKLNVTDAENVYATKEALQSVKDGYATTDSVTALETALGKRIDLNETSIDNFGLTYNSATSELVYTDKNGVSKTYKLYSGSLVKSGKYENGNIVLEIETAGQASQITIPVSELVSDIDAKISVNSNAIKSIEESMTKLAKSWEVTPTDTIELAKSTSGEKDSLSAKVKVASSNKQAIQSTGDGLYVSNDLEDFTVVYGADGTVSAQKAISNLKETIETTKTNLEKEIATNVNNIATLKSEIAAAQENIKTLTNDVTTAKSNIGQLQNDVTANTSAIDNVKVTVKALDNTVTQLSTRVATSEASVANVTNRLTTIETEVKTQSQMIETYKTQIDSIKNSVDALAKAVDDITGEGGELKSILAEISKIKTVTGYENYSSTKNMSERIDTLETEGSPTIKDEINKIENELIGPKDGSVDGSVWNKINNLIDAGTFN